MELRYDLVDYSDELRDAYLELLPEQELEVARGKLEWKFRHSPAGPGVVAVAREGDRIIGLNGFMSGRFRVGPDRVLGFQSMDTIVSPAARGKGVFGRLLNIFYEQTDGTLLYGFPNMNSSPAFFGKLGWSHFGPVPMLVRPLRTGYFLKRIANFLPDVPIPILAPRMRDAEQIDQFDEDATRVWQQFAAGIGCAVERDAEFLNWRVAGHTTERYTTLRASDGAFAISNVANKHGTRIGYLMDAIGTERSISRLIVESLHRMRANGAALAFAWCLPWSPNYRAYRRAGFYPFPSRFRPIVLNFGARGLKPGSSEITSAAAWYVSYLDSDTA